MKAKRILASILALALTASSLPSQAWAAKVFVAPTAPVSVIPGGTGAAGAAGTGLRLAPVQLGNMPLGAVPNYGANPAFTAAPTLVSPNLVSPAGAAPASAVNGAAAPSGFAARPAAAPNFSPSVSQVALPQSAIAPQSAGAHFTPEATQASGRFGFSQAAKRESEGARPATTFGALRATGKTLTSGVNAGALAALFTGETQLQAVDFQPVSNGFAALASRGGRGLNRATVSAQTPHAAASFAGKIGHAENALLQAPNGRRIDVLVARTPEQDEKWLMNRTDVPGDGVLSVVEGPGEFKLWLKNTLVPLDFVVLDGQGLVTSVHSKLGPSPAKTHWKDIPLVSANGTFALALPAGRAAELGAEVGTSFAAVAGTNIAEPLDPEEAADMILSGDLYAVSAAVEDFAGRTRDDKRFEAVMAAAKSQLAHLQRDRKPQARRALVEFVAQVNGRMNTSGAYGGIFSNTFPGLYFLNQYARAPWLLPIGVLGGLLTAAFTFIHEGGHYLAAKLLGQKVSDFRVFLNGAGYIQTEGNRTGLRSALISWAGPAAGLAVAALFMILPVFTFQLIGPMNFSEPAPASTALALMVTVAAPLISMLIAYTQWKGGVSDWISSLQALGFHKLAAEAAWRFELVRQKRLSLGYTQTWLSLLTRPRLDTSTAPPAQEETDALFAAAARN